MKRILSVTTIFTFAFLMLSAFSLRENPQDPPRGKKVEKHIKMVKVNEDGEKVELDTVLSNDNVFVWEGDTVGGAKKMKWISDEDFDFEMDFDIDVKEDGDGKVIIMKSGKGGKTMVKEYKIDGDSNHKFLMEIDEDGKHGKHDIMMWNSKEGNEMIIRAPKMVGAPHPPHAPNAAFFGHKKQGNVIDLSDPGIISYDKKKMKNGTEKITIIRKEVPKENIELHEEIIMHRAGSQPMIIHEGHPGKTKTMKIIKSDDGNIEIIEDGKLMKIKKGSGNSKFITEDGNVYHIKETKENGEKKVEVNVEVKEEVEKEEK
jgi:hypothetical protein